MRFKDRLIVVVWLGFAAVMQVAWYYLLRSAGLPNASAALVLLTLFPGGVGWYLPFAYAVRMRRDRARASSHSGR